MAGPPSSTSTRLSGLPGENRTRPARRLQRHHFGHEGTKLSAPEDRELWDDYGCAYEEALNATTDDHAPWHAIPSDHLYTQVAEAEALRSTLEGLDPALSELDEDELREAEIDRSQTIS